jgi:hypothetical protein
MVESYPRAMAEFFERLGHKIIQSRSAWWYDVQPGVLLSFPYYKLVESTEEETTRLMYEHKPRALRFPTALENFGFVSNLALNTKTDYDLADQHQKARNQTRRGLENCKVEQIDFNFLMDKGLELNRETAERQGRKSHYAKPDYWRKYCQAAKETAYVNSWAAFVKGNLASFLIAIEVDDWVEWIVHQSSTRFLKVYPNNALIYTAAQHFFKERGCKGICYGLGSLEQTSHLDHFKQRMGWTLEPIKQRLIFSKNMQIALSLAREPFLKILGKFFPKNYTARKAIAMIRLYHQQSYDIPRVDSEKGR